MLKVSIWIMMIIDSKIIEKLLPVYYYNFTIAGKNDMLSFFKENKNIVNLHPSII